MSYCVVIYIIHTNRYSFNWFDNDCYLPTRWMTYNASNPPVNIRRFWSVHKLVCRTKISINRYIQIISTLILPYIQKESILKIRLKIILRASCWSAWNLAFCCHPTTNDNGVKTINEWIPKYLLSTYNKPYVVSNA